MTTAKLSKSLAHLIASARFLSAILWNFLRNKKPSLAFPLPSCHLTKMFVDVEKGGRRGLCSPLSRSLEGQRLQARSLSLPYEAP